MRLIYTTYNSDRGRTLANFLSSEGIENQLEMAKSNDWGQNDYGDTLFRIWVIDEDAADAAEKWAEAFEKDPENPFYQKTGSPTTVIPTILAPGEQTIKSPKIDLMNSGNNRNNQNGSLKPEPFRTITTGLLMLCILFYLISSMTSPHITSVPAYLPGTPITSAPIEKQFFYDYPRAYELVDKLVKLYGVEKLQFPESLPPEGQFLLKEFNNAPYWEGYYNHLLAYFKNIEPPNTHPLFEKIKEGEIWRLFTPCLIHASFLHILFNMMWLIVLGKQMEERLNTRRYMLFILIVGIFSNTCQYLMGGPNFLGFSGVVCGMVAFIYVRQKIAPWEGYPLDLSTSLFVLYFILALLGIQLVSFYMEVNHNTSFSPGIANTAHLTGAVMGALLGALPFFRKSNKAVGPIR